jgi:hypothetical protein
MTPKLILSAKSVDEVGVSSQKLPSSVPGGEQFPRRLKKKVTKVLKISKKGPMNPNKKHNRRNHLAPHAP